MYDIGDAAENRCRLKQALIQDECFSSLYTLPPPNPLSRIKLSSKVFSQITEELSQDFDYVLIDCPAGIEDGFHRAVSGASEALVVTTPHISAVRRRR